MYQGQIAIFLHDEVKMHSLDHESVEYPCDQCDYKATLKGNILKHLKSKHEGIKFPCDQCDYKATKKVIYWRI